ncbi:Bromodomain-containing protein [Lentithecium fluviatile CBS 122367]|uniref:Bromodomain-containing protein n=1 Tax=Lentithecium fluviatile CBS 122367 TaxID=1168545 RepID=A0A6G1JGW9_9PLEO|nr:Bromodomain-containing protein [Lentithecium fluviatile CBS 122367]
MQICTPQSAILCAHKQIAISTQPSYHVHGPMAVMTSSTFDTVPLDLKPTSLPMADPMTIDTDTNGVHDLHVDDQDVAPLPTMNGNHKSFDTALATEPTTNVSSGIEGVAQFLPDSQADNNSLFGGSEADAPSIRNALEAPTSDVRDEAGPDASATTQPSSESTQKVPETQLPSTGLPQSDDMDLNQDAPDATATTNTSTAPPTKPMNDLRIETQDTTSQLPFSQSPTNLDQEMEDAPASGKVRPREDDLDDAQDEERDAKRTKTMVEADEQAEFKVPPVPNHSGQSNGSAPSAASGQQHSFVQEAASYKDWPTAPINEAQRRFLLERIRNTKKIKVSLAFKEPVDFIALNIPQYPDFVKNPMDLGTMETKLKGGGYHQIVDFMKDLDQMVTNSELFNGKDHPVTQNGYNMRAYFLKGCDRLPREGEEPAKPSKPVKKPTASTAPKPRRESRTATTAKSPTAPTPTAASPNNPWPLQSDGLPLIRRDSSSANDRPKREIHRPPSKDLPYSTAKPRKKKYQQELKFCESVVAEIMKPKYAKFSYPFLAPVDPVALNIPSYLKIIKNPKDFGTIEKDLKAGAYQSAKDFYKDANLVFQNCYKFNIEGDEVHKMGKQLHELFNSLWSEKGEWLAQHAPEAEPQSPGSGYSDEEDEEEEEEADPAQAQFLAIQQQIAQLNETAQQLLQQQKGKRTSPKAPSKKKSKSSAMAQPKRRNTQLSVPPPPPKAGKPKARAKAPAPLSYTQKQEISDGISTLGDADMRRAVQIIRNGCPNLANTNDDEMELDMDEINDDTLRELFKFIKSVRGPRGAVADDDFEPPRPVQRQNTASRPKKNKPMGKSEQEDSLRRIQEKMQSFNGAVSGSSQSPPANNDETSDDDDESASESEEE